MTAIDWIFVWIAVAASGLTGIALAVFVQWCRRPHSEGKGEHPTPNIQHPTSNGIVFVRTWKPLTPEQWAQAFRDWPETDPRWRALWDCLSFHLEAELMAGQAAKVDSDEVMQWNGRVQAYLFVRTQLLQLRRASEQ